MPDNKSMSAQAASRLLADLDASPQVDDATDELMDRGVAGLLSPDEFAALQTRLRQDSWLAAIYREREEDLREQLPPTRLEEIGARIYARLREQIPELRPAEPPRSPQPSIPERGRAMIRHCSEALRGLVDAFFCNVMIAKCGAHTDPAVEESGDRTAAFTTASRPAGGVRFVVTSYNAQDAGLQLKFNLEPSGDWQRVITLERCMPGVDVWEGVLELSSSDLKELSGPTARKIRARPLSS